MHLSRSNGGENSEKNTPSAKKGFMIVPTGARESLEDIV
jgi:hypothetical protein